MKSEISVNRIPEKVKENFLKIVTNIFLLTAYNTFLELKKEWNKNTKLDYVFVDTVYQNNLKNIRKKVYKFFGVEKQEEVNVKYLVRLYPYILPENNPVLIEYRKQSNNINLLLDNLRQKLYPKAFLDYETLEISDVRFIFN